MDKKNASAKAVPAKKAILKGPVKTSALVVTPRLAGNHNQTLLHA